MKKNWTFLPWRTHLTDETLIVDAHGNEVCRVAGDYETDYQSMSAYASLIIEGVNAHAAGDRAGYERGVRDAAQHAFTALSHIDSSAAGTAKVAALALLPAQPKEPK